MVGASSIFFCSRSRPTATLLTFALLLSPCYAQTDFTPYAINPLASPQGNSTWVDPSPFEPTRQDWTILITRVLTQYFLWWLTDLLIMVAWKRLSWRLWLKKVMRKILLQWRPGAVFMLSCQPSTAAEAIKVLDNSAEIPGLASMALTLMIDLSTLVSGALSLQKQYGIPNAKEGSGGWKGMDIFFSPVAPAIVSSISTITALCKTRNSIRITLIVLGLIAWPAVYLPAAILHDPGNFLYITLVVYILQLNPFFIMKLELVMMALIGFDRVLTLPIVSSANIVSTGFPFPALNTWAFAGPLLTLGIITLIIAEVSLVISYGEIQAYIGVLFSKLGARMTRTSKPPPTETTVLPMHQISDQLIEDVIAHPPCNEKDEPSEDTKDFAHSPSKEKDEPARTSKTWASEEGEEIEILDIRGTAATQSRSTPNTLAVPPKTPTPSRNPYKQTDNLALTDSSTSTPSPPTNSPSNRLLPPSTSQTNNVAPPPRLRTTRISEITQLAVQPPPPSAPTISTPNPVPTPSADVWYRMMGGREADGERI
ncbi:hypothetical protein Unana1_07641 [Umbelopsis nana]